MEDNDEVEDNNKGVSALGLDIDLGFSRGHQTRQNQTILNQNHSRNLADIRTNSLRFAQSRTYSHKLAQISAK